MRAARSCGESGSPPFECVCRRRARRCCAGCSRRRGSSVRIVAGSRKGHTIHAPKGLDTRPTGDRVREAAYNLIGPVDGARVLDLYAGSGAMGLEALSRGAESVVFVERDKAAADAIVRNLAKLDLMGATVLREDAVRVLAADAAAGRRY